MKKTKEQESAFVSTNSEDISTPFIFSEGVDSSLPPTSKKKKSYYVPLNTGRRKKKQEDGEKPKRKYTRRNRSLSPEKEPDMHIEIDEEQIYREVTSTSDADPTLRDAYQALQIDIEKYPLILPDKEKELSAKIRAGDVDAFHLLVMSNIRLVVACVRQTRRAVGNGGSILDFMDLVHEGVLGLLTAAYRFDGRRGVKFCTYALRWIIQRIRRSIARQRTGLTVPGYAGTSAFKLGEYIHAWRNGKMEEIPEKMRKRIGALNRITSPMLSIDSGGPSEDPESEKGVINGERSDIEGLATDGEVRLAELFFQKDLRNALEQELSPDDLDIISRRFALAPYASCQSLKEIGEAYGKSSEYARLTIERVIKKLRTSERMSAFRPDATKKESSRSKKKKEDENEEGDE